LTKDEQLARARVAITNALAQPDIKARIAERGYDEAEMTAGKTLLDAATQAVGAQTTAGGARSKATDDRNDAESLARAAYQEMAETARAVFYGDKARQAQLGVAGATPRSVPGLLQRASTFFQAVAAVSDLAEPLAKRGLKPARLAEMRARFDALAGEHEAQTRALGLAQQATRDQNAALTALNGWMAPFERIVKLALKDKPDLLDALGLRPRATPARRKPDPNDPLPPAEPTPKL